MTKVIGCDVSFWWEDSELAEKLIGEWAWNYLPHFDGQWAERQGLGVQTASNAFTTYDDSIREQLWAIRELKGEGDLAAMEPEDAPVPKCAHCGGVPGSTADKMVIDDRGDVRTAQATHWERERQKERGYE